ncbi:MAG: photosynthetic complex putative assembly protein PuhB [Deltaproteobacteria bacterium]
MSDVEVEPIPGLPEELPAGEHIVWQGQPHWRTLAQHAFHVRTVALYFGGIVTLRVGAALINGEPFVMAAWSVVVVTALSAVGLGLLCLLAYLNARTSMYTITNRRVVMRVGVAFPITFNLPFKSLSGAALKAYPNGAGEIALSLSGSDRLAYLHLWPHARPWNFRKSSPMLRAVPKAQDVAQLLAQHAQGVAA